MQAIQFPIQWSTERIFVSSTFIDMGPERDLLVKRVFPNLRAAGEVKRKHIAGVDLRWGIPTDDETERQQVIARCLSAVDICRPHFLGLIGYRRGWIPEVKDTDDECLQRYPNLRSALSAALSLTEIEILHALCPLDGSAQSPQNILIYSQRAQGSGLSEQLVSVLADYGIHVEHDTERIEMRRYSKVEAEDRQPVLQYNGASLEVQLVTDLMRSLDLVPLESELQAPLDIHERVRALAVVDAPPANDELQILRDHLMKGSRLVVIEGKPDSGQTSLIAQFVTQLSASGRRKVLFRFLGAAEAPGDEETLLMSLYDELNTGLARPNTIPVEPREIRTRWAEAWADVEQPRDLPVLVLEGLDQAPSDAQALHWLLAPVRYGATVVVSLDPESQQGRDLLTTLLGLDRVYRLQPAELETRESRVAFINTRLAFHLKALDRATTAVLTEHPASRDPLFLSIVLSELRTHGYHGDLAQVARQRFDKGLEGAITSLLERLESESGALGPSGVNIVFGALARSPSGLSTEELSKLVEDTLGVIPGTSDEIESLLHQLDTLLQRRPHAHAISSSRLQEAIRQRYRSLSPDRQESKAEAERRWHELLSALRQETCSSRDDATPANRAAYVRALRDLPYHLRASGQIDQLAHHLLDPGFVVERLRLLGLNRLRWEIQDCGASISDPLLREQLAELDQLLAAAADQFYQILTQKSPEAADIAQLLTIQAGVSELRGVEAGMTTLVSAAAKHARVRLVLGGSNRGSVIRARPDSLRLFLSPDGGWLVTVGQYGECCLWSTQNLYQYALLNYDEGGVKRARFSPDGTLLALAMDDRSVRIVHAATGCELAPPLSFDRPIVDLCWVDDALCVCALENGEVAAIDRTRGTQNQTHCEGATVIAAPAGMSSVLIGTNDGSLFTADLPLLTTPRLVAPATGSQGAVVAIAASAQRDRAWTLSENGWVQEWDLREGTVNSPFQEIRTLNDLALHPDGRTLAAANAMGELSLYHLDTYERRTFKCVQNSADAVVIDPQGRCWVAGQPDLDVTEVICVDLDQPEALAEAVFGVALSPDGQIAVDIRSWGRVWARSALDGTHLFDIESTMISRAFSCTFNKSGTVLMIGTLMELLVVNPLTQQVLAALGAMGAWQDVPFDGVRAIAIDEGDTFFVAGDSQGYLAAFNRRYEAFAATQLDTPPSKIEILPGGKVLVAEESGQIMCFDSSLSQAVRWPRAPHRCWAMAAAPGRGAFYSSHVGGLIARWALDDPQDPDMFEAGIGEIESLHVLTGENVLVGGGRSGILRFWDLKDWGVMLDLHFPGAVENVAFSRDNSTVLLSLAQGVLITLDLQGFI